MSARIQPFLTRVSPHGNQRKKAEKRDCLTAEPWASESARQIPLLLAPRIAYRSFISISEKVRRMSVFPGKFLHLMIAFVAFCLTRGRRLTFANEIAPERRRAARHAYF